MTDLNLKLSDHFTAREFQCHNGDPLRPNFHKTIKDTVEFLERLRWLMNAVVEVKTGENKNIGLRVVSGHRTLDYNTRIGSKPTSAHVSGQAADIAPIRGYQHGFNYKEFHDMAIIIDRTFDDRPYRIGKYSGSGFVHIDCRYGHGGRRWGK